jgi:hypothetical protein
MRKRPQGETFRALRKWHGDRHLAMGSWKTLAAVCRGMTRLAIPAWHKGHGCQGEDKDKAVTRTQKGWMFGKRRWANYKASME